MARTGKPTKRSVAKKGGLRKRGGMGRKLRLGRPRMSQPDWCSITCSTNLSGLTTNTMYSRLNTSLDQFARAVNQAQGFQFYRITSIKLQFQPRLDTFVGGGASTVPYFYYMIDKGGSLPNNVTVGNLLQMGAKPIRFDDKTVKVQWRPAVVQDVATAGGGAPVSSSPARYSISPWLNTNANFADPMIWNPSTVDHLGIYWIVETTGANSLYDAVLTVDFQFKKPLVLASPDAPLATSI